MVKCTSDYIKFITTTTTNVPTCPTQVEILLLSLPFWSHDHFPAFWLVTHRLFLTTCHMISINNPDWLIPITHFYFYIIYTWVYGSGTQIEDLAPFTIMQVTALYLPPPPQTWNLGTYPLPPTDIWWLSLKTCSDLFSLGPNLRTPPLVLTPCGGHWSGQYASYWNAFLFWLSCFSVTMTLHL